MEQRHSSRLAAVVVGAAAVLVAAGCAPGPGPDANAAGRIAELEAEVEQQRAECGAITAERDAAAPLVGLPEIEQQGPPLAELPTTALPLPVDRGRDDCPSERWAIVRAETGTSCATYQAEISSWAERCVVDCDRPGLALQAVEIAAARCVEYCSSKSCGARVTFIPPPNGCAAYDCFDSERCRSVECPKLEYCSLLSTNRVWNCFCRDLIPT